MMSQTQMSEHMTFCDSIFCAETRLVKVETAEVSVASSLTCVFCLVFSPLSLRDHL